MVLQIASGPLLVGMMKGFMQLHGQDQIQRFRGLQQSMACALVRAYRDGASVSIGQADTIASAISDTLDGYERGISTWSG